MEYDDIVQQVIEFLGTFAFAISGALVAVRHRLDLFGVLVLSFAAATAGGPETPARPLFLPQREEIWIPFIRKERIL